MSISTKRHPYVREMKSGWWKTLGFYKFYMLRESSALANIWFSIVLLYGLCAVANGPDVWSGFVAFLQSPFILILNLISLILALIHSKTWFDLAPKATNIIVHNEKMSPAPIVKGLWAITLIITLVILVASLR